MKLRLINETWRDPTPSIDRHLGGSVGRHSYLELFGDALEDFNDDINEINEELDSMLKLSEYNKSKLLSVWGISHDELFNIRRATGALSKRINRTFVLMQDPNGRSPPYLISEFDGVVNKLWSFISDSVVKFQYMRFPELIKIGKKITDMFVNLQRYCSQMFDRFNGGGKEYRPRKLQFFFIGRSADSAYVDAPFEEFEEISPAQAVQAVQWSATNRAIIEIYVSEQDVNEEPNLGIVFSDGICTGFGLGSDTTAEIEKEVKEMKDQQLTDEELLGFFHYVVSNYSIENNPHYEY